jgi:NTP pyrophosphatase (non-canonical NTP hydrolase)
MSDKYEKLNNLNEEHEALTILMEECGEVIQEASKIIRFNQGELINIVRLSKEIGDLMVMIEILHNVGLVDESVIENAMKEKREKLKFYSGLINE